MRNDSFSRLLSNYLTQYLPGIRGLGTNTILSYRDMFKNLVIFYETVLKIKPEKIMFNNFNAENIRHFLNWLEAERNNSISTRNVRLASLHAFARFIERRSPENIQNMQEILLIPYKKSSSPIPIFLSPEAAKLLLNMPDPRLKTGRRDRVLLVSGQSAPCHWCGRSESSSDTGVVESLTRMSSSQRRKFTLFLRHVAANPASIAKCFPPASFPANNQFFRPNANGRMTFSAGYPDVGISGRTPQPGNCDHPKELPLCRKRKRRPESGDPVFIRGLLQSQRPGLRKLAERRPAAPGKRNPDRIRRTPAPSLEAGGIIHQNRATAPPLAARHVAGWALTDKQHSARRRERLHR